MTEFLMGSEKLTCMDLLRAGYDGAMEAGKTNAGVAFALGFLGSIQNRCSALDKDEIVQLSLQAKQMQIDDIRECIAELHLENSELRQDLEAIGKGFLAFLGERQAIPSQISHLVRAVDHIACNIESLLEGQDDAASHRERIESKMDVLIEASHHLRSGSGMTGTPADATGFHPRIDSAAHFLHEYRPDAALAMLEVLDKEHWSDLTPRERYRLRANQGHAKRQQGLHEEAARLFLEAYGFQPGDDNAMALAVDAYLALEQPEEAGDMASKALQVNPNSASVVAAYIRSRPADTSFQELEGYAPPHLRSSLEVTIQLASQALRRELYTDAEKYGRLGITANAEEPYPHYVVGASLFGPVGAKALKRARLLGEDHSRLAEALECLAESEKLIGRFNDDSLRVAILINRGCIFRVQDRVDDAEHCFHAARALQPRDPDVIYHEAALLMQKDNAASACDRLRQVPQEEWSTRHACLFMWAAAETGDREAMETALTETAPLAVDLARESMDNRLSYLAAKTQPLVRL